MGIVPNVRHDQFPNQRRLDLGTRVRVCFAYDTAHQVLGTIVRYDAEEPFEEIIRLDDCIPNTEIPRFIRTTECMWSPMRDPEPGDVFKSFEGPEEETTT